MLFSSWCRRLLILSFLATIFGRSSVVFGQDLSELARRFVLEPNLLESTDFVKSEYENLLTISNLRNSDEYDPGSTVEVSLRQKVTDLLLNPRSKRSLDALIAASGAFTSLDFSAYEEAGLLWDRLERTPWIANHITELANGPQTIAQLNEGSNAAILLRLESRGAQHSETIKQIARLVAKSNPANLLEPRGLRLLYIIQSHAFAGFAQLPSEARELADLLRAKVLQTARSPELLGRLSDPSNAVQYLMQTLELMSVESATMIQDEIAILKGVNDPKVQKCVQRELLRSVEKNHERWRSASESELNFVTTILAESLRDAKDTSLAIQALKTTAALVKENFNLPPWLQQHAQKFLADNHDLGRRLSSKARETIELAGLGPCNRTNAMVNRP